MKEIKTTEQKTGYNPKCICGKPKVSYKVWRNKRLYIIATCEHCEEKYNPIITTVDNKPKDLFPPKEREELRERAIKVITKSQSSLMVNALDRITDTFEFIKQSRSLNSEYDESYYTIEVPVEIVTSEGARKATIIWETNVQDSPTVLNERSINEMADDFIQIEQTAREIKSKLKFE